MHDTWYETLIGAQRGLASRRTAVRSAALRLAAALGIGGLATADAKKGKNKKKKCKKPKIKCKKKCCAAGQVCASGKCTTPPAEECQFSKTATLWTLQADCTITKTIEIPDGVTLDGNGKTITMSGAVANYLKNVPDDWAVAAAVLANGGSANVHDLTIRGSGLTGSCSAGLFPEGLSFINTSGEIRNVNVEEIALSGNGLCGFGVTATGTGGQTVNIEDVTADGCPNAGVLGLTRVNTPGITVNVDGVTVTYEGQQSSIGVDGGIVFDGGRVGGTISNANVTIPRGHGIFVLGRGDMGGELVEISDVTIANRNGNGILAALSSEIPQSGTFTVNVTRADITATGEPGIDFLEGIVFGGGGADFAGSVDDSIIRGGDAGIGQDGVSQMTIQDTTIAGSFIGVYNIGGTLDVHDNTFSGVAAGIVSSRIGSLPVDATISNNTFEGGSPTAESAFGVFFSDGATGTVSGNTISNFFDTDPSKPSCGIGVYENAGEVTIGTNTFPDPPGNEEDICLDIPLPPEPLRAGRKGKDALGIEALRQMRNRADRFKASDHASRDRRRSKQKNKGGRAHQKRGDKH